MDKLFIFVRVIFINLIICIISCSNISKDILNKMTMVTTFAGNCNYGDLDGSKRIAKFDRPAALVFDSYGNLYIADTYNNKIRKITPSGEVSTFAGCSCCGDSIGHYSEARFKGPSGLVFDCFGNLYVADTYNHKIKKITSSGDVITFAGSGVKGDVDGYGEEASFNCPCGLAIDTKGNIYVADYENHRIRKISPSGDVTTFAGNSNSGDADGIGSEANFDHPSGLVFDSYGILYVTDSYNHKIKKITPAGKVTTFAGSGNRGETDGKNTDASFNCPSGLAIDREGNLFVSDYENHKIRKINPAGEVTTFAGNGIPDDTDGVEKEASFFYPAGLAFDKVGNLYVADTYNNKIRKIIPAKTIKISNEKQAKIFIK